MSPLSRLAESIRHAPVRSKLALIIAATCGAGIITAATALFVFQTLSLRDSFQRDISALASIVASNLSGALAFNDATAAREILGALKAKPQIESAIVRTADGNAFAATGRPTAADQENSAFTGTRYVGWELQATSPILVGKETAGQLCLCANFYPTFVRSLQLYCAAVVLISLGALALALIIGRRLQGLVAEPVQRLSEAARHIGEERDYRVRVAKLGNDELGILTDTFNGMLDRLQAADLALRNANASLATEMAERQRLNTELVEASRRAGMADVATGVLHNVGNVLNSVNVSATLVQDQVARSRIEDLLQATGLLQAHRDDPGAYLTQDPRGRHLPEFIIQVAGLLATEHQAWREELATLVHRVEHIKEIVAMQQAYAKVAGVAENLSPLDLAEDAIRINEAALVRHGIRLQRDFHPTPSVLVDRHKVLQVLVNLISNAKYAVDRLPADRKRVVFTIGPAGDDRVRFTVTDNGVGIPAENLDRIFSLGFTTRNSGHGFGLHSGAIAARELGGTLTARSDGPDCGATFALEIPLQPVSP